MTTIDSMTLWHSVSKRVDRIEELLFHCDPETFRKFDAWISGDSEARQEIAKADKKIEEAAQRLEIGHGGDHVDMLARDTLAIKSDGSTKSFSQGKIDFNILCQISFASLPVCLFATAAK